MTGSRGGHRHARLATDLAEGMRRTPAWRGACAGR